MNFLTGRSHTCGELNPNFIGEKVTLSGWVNTVRDMGGLIFVDLRDRYGITQLVFEPEQTPEKLIQEASALKSESSLTVEGTVRQRSRPNQDLPTGQVEVLVTALCVHNLAPTLPFEVGVDKELNIDTRMKWRFLDLRRSSVKGRLPFRHQVVRAIREQFDQEGFVDVETPVLFKSTPEGARDYLVPSRLYPGEFYALPQSPQTLKQVLMSSGLDKYYQIVKCFRDEDLRGDRQPEFTQLDMEMSFVDREDVFAVIERTFQNVFKQAMNQELTVPFERMTYQEALATYGHDAPDVRFGLKHHFFNEEFRETDFGVIKSALDAGGDLRFLSVPGGATLSRKELEALTQLARDNGAGGLLWCKYQNGEFSGPVSKFLSEEQKRALQERLTLADNTLILGVADQKRVAAQSLHKVRLAVAEKLDLINKNDFRFLWIIDFPLFEETENGGLTYNHHPFCFPSPEDRHLMESEPLKVRAWSYDLVLNGWELGSGSIRNHEVELQQNILDLIGVSRDQQEAQFGFLFKALKYGAPPHGGIALGVDRVVTLLGGESDIREYIAFPKTHNGRDLYSECPSPVSARQMEDLHLKLHETRTQHGGNQ